MIGAAIKTIGDAIPSIWRLSLNLNVQSQHKDKYRAIGVSGPSDGKLFENAHVAPTKSADMTVPVARLRIKRFAFIFG